MGLCGPSPSTQTPNTHRVGDSLPFGRSPDVRVHTVLDPHREPSPSPRGISTQRSDVRRLAGLSVPRLRDRDRGRIDPPGVKDGPLSCASDDPVAARERAHQRDLSVHEGSDDDRRGPAVAQESSYSRESLGDAVRRRSEVGELGHVLIAGARSAQLLRPARSHEPSRGVKPRQGTGGRRADGLPKVGGLGCRPGRGADDEIARVGQVRPRLRPGESGSDDVGRGPGPLELRGGDNSANLRLHARLWSPSAQSLVPPQPRAGFASSLYCLHDLGPRRDRRHGCGRLRLGGLRRIAHPVTLGSYSSGVSDFVPALAAPTPDSVTLLAFVVILLGAGAALMALISRRGQLSSPEASATYRTLHAASEAARHLRDGLTPKAAARAARDLRPLLGVTAVGFCDSGGILAWEGEGEHHRASVEALVTPVLETGATIRLHEGDLSCPDPDCPVRGAILAPIVADDKVVAVLGSFHTGTTADLARATEAVAGWVSTQVDLAELGRERERAVEAELRALRAQISPHFIYNSLAAIASFIRTDPVRARELLLEFADFTRYSLRASGPFASLKEELGNVERYLILEQARFGERLEISLTIEPEVLSVEVPTLTIQPLVENAVQHGIEDTEGVGHVVITATDHGAEAEITIEDDGAGADPDVMRSLLSGQGRGDHVGIGNVDARLRQTYGDAHGLIVETAPGAGMKVTFRVPKFSARRA